jgi:hypothetical protein
MNTPPNNLLMNNGPMKNIKLHLELKHFLFQLMVKI